MIEQITRSEWLSRNPVVRRYVEQNPVGWTSIPSFNLWPDANDIEGITEHQREQLNKALANRVGVLGGSPGTGKTWTVAKLIKHMLENGSLSAFEIGIGAPTGKAAVRLTENLQSNGLDLRARTWHSLLGIGSSSQTGGFGFKHNQMNPFPYRVIIGDESSMLDLSLTTAIFKARDIGCHILLVGDVNQLAPVGSGAPLRDIINAGLPYGELTEIIRNSGGIVEACAAIRDCEPWTHMTRSKGSNLTITGDADPENKKAKILELIEEACMNGMDPIWDVQVLVAVNESSPMSRKTINAMLQEELNDGEKFDGTIFRPKDKIVCLKNSFYKSVEVNFVDEPSEEIQNNERGEVFVANGELGEVLQIKTGEMIVGLDSPARVVSVALRGKPDQSEEPSDESKSSAVQWDLGYALSVHKSQGSDWPVIIGVLDGYAGARMICDRSWIYTLISRAKTKCFLVGTDDLAERFCRVAKIGLRKTFLKEKIQMELFKKELGDL